MKVSMTHSYLGHNFSLTFDSDVTEDLDDVQERIGRVMRRELARFGEIVAVGVKDKEYAEARAFELRRLKGSNEVLLDATVGRGPTRFHAGAAGPTQILGAGNKDPKTGRVIVDRKTGAVIEGSQVEAHPANEGGGQ